MPYLFPTVLPAPAFRVCMCLAFFAFSSLVKINFVYRLYITFLIYHIYLSLCIYTIYPPPPHSQVLNAHCDDNDRVLGRVADPIGTLSSLTSAISSLSALAAGGKKKNRMQQGQQADINSSSSKQQGSRGRQQKSPNGSPEGSFQVCQDHVNFSMPVNSRIYRNDKS